MRLGITWSRAAKHSGSHRQSSFPTELPGTTCLWTSRTLPLGYKVSHSSLSCTERLRIEALDNRIKYKVKPWTSRPSSVKWVSLVRPCVDGSSVGLPFFPHLTLFLMAKNSLVNNLCKNPQDAWRNLSRGHHWLGDKSSCLQTGTARKV